MGSYLSHEDFDEFYGYFLNNEVKKNLFSRTNKQTNKFLLYFTFIFSRITLFLKYYFNVVINIFFNVLSFLFFIFDKIFIFLDRKKVIYRKDKKSPYLIRYYLLFKNRPDWFPFNIFIHKFLQSDDADLHDHPWDYFTFILYGGYYEYIENNDTLTKNKIIKIWRPPGFFKYSSAYHKHRVELLNTNQCCWTLFIPGKKIKNWGFYKNNQFLNPDEYYKSF